MDEKEEWDYVDDYGVGYKIAFQEETVNHAKRVVWKSSILPSWKDVCWWSRRPSRSKLYVNDKFKIKDIEQLEEQLLNYPHWE